MTLLERLHEAADQADRRAADLRAAAQKLAEVESEALALLEGAGARPPRRTRDA
jgi:hypothetical protein